MVRTICTDRNLTYMYTDRYSAVTLNNPFSFKPLNHLRELTTEV